VFAARRGRPRPERPPIPAHAGRTPDDGIVSVDIRRGSSRAALPVLRKLLERRNVPPRNGLRSVALIRRCGRLLGYVEPHINRWDCLPPSP